MDYDTYELGFQARRVADLRAELAAARAELIQQIRGAAAAGVPQVEIMRITGYSRDQARILEAGSRHR